MTKELALPEKDEEQVKALEWLRTFDVETADDVRQLDGLCVKAKEHEKKGEDLFREAIEDAHQTHKGLLAKLKTYVSAAVEFRKIAKEKIWTWEREQEKIRQAEEQKLQAQAKELEDNRQLAEAQLAEDAGDHEAAQEIVNRPVQTPVIVLPKSTPKRETTISGIWTFRYVDKAGKPIDFLQATKLNLVPHEYWMIDNTAIGQIGRARKGNVSIPGVEFYQKPA